MSTPRRGLRARDHLREFSETSSMHGLGRAMGGQRCCWRRLLWCGLLLAAAGWSVYTVEDVLRDFLTYPVATSRASAYPGALRFPAVTVCNLNSVTRSSLPRHVLEMVDNLSDLGYGENYIQNAVKVLTRTEGANSMGHRMEDMLVSCFFAEEECTHENFTTLSSEKYGQCFKFASVDDPHRSEWQTVTAGPRLGLVLELNVQVEEYMATSPASGVVVFLNDYDTPASPDERGGIMVGPGQATSIGIRKKTSTHLPSPYGVCVTYEGTDYLGYIEGYRYTPQACNKDCLQVRMYERCQCCFATNTTCKEEMLLRFADISPANGAVEICDTRNASTKSCTEQVLIEFVANKLDCVSLCPPACEKSMFSAVISNGQWPTDPYIPVLVKKMLASGTIDKRAANSQELEQHLHSSLLRLQVYFESLFVEKVEQSPAYTWRKLLSDIGGQLGLTLGCSIMTAVEILQLLLVDLPPALCRHGRGNTALQHGEERASESPGPVDLYASLPES